MKHFYFFFLSISFLNISLAQSQLAIKKITDYPNYLQPELKNLGCNDFKDQYIQLQNFYGYDYTEDNNDNLEYSYILNKSSLISDVFYNYTLSKGETLDYQYFPKSNKTKLEQSDYFWILVYNSRLPKTSTVQSKVDHFQIKPKELGQHQIFFVQKTTLKTCLVTRLNSFYVTDNPAYEEVEKKTFANAFKCYQTHLKQELNQYCQELPSLEELYHLKQINAPRAWEINTGQGVKIALIDSGTNYLHPYLKEQLITPLDKQTTNQTYDFEFNDQFPFDENGHGSQMAGFISSAFGVAPHAKTLSLKINSRKIHSIIKAFKASVKNKVQIINLSLVYPNYLVNMRSDLKKELLLSLDQLLENDILVIQAAGNESKDLDIKLHQHFFSQFNYPNWIKVAAYDENFNIASYSNYSSNRVDLIAPGGSFQFPLLSTFIHNEQGVILDSNKGTSQASAITTGIAALIRSQKPHLNALEVKEILLQSGKFSKDLKPFVRSSRLLNAWDALNIK